MQLFETVHEVERVGVEERELFLDGNREIASVVELLARKRELLVCGKPLLVAPRRSLYGLKGDRKRPWNRSRAASPSSPESAAARESALRSPAVCSSSAPPSLHSRGARTTRNSRGARTTSMPCWTSSARTDASSTSRPTSPIPTRLLASSRRRAAPTGPATRPAATTP